MEPPVTDIPYVPRARIEVCPQPHRNIPMDRYACFHRRMTSYGEATVAVDATTKLERSGLQASLGSELFHQGDLAAVIDAMLDDAVQQGVIVMVPLWDNLL